MKRTFWLLLVIGCSGHLSAQTTVNFNFSAASQPVSGWINVAGDPSTGVRSVTDPVSGITISSIATANWAPWDVSAYDGLGASGGTFFPEGVMLNHWYQYYNNGTVANYNPNVPQLLISGLRTDSVYTLLMTGSSTSASLTSPTMYTVSGLSVSGPIAVNNHNNTASGAVFYNIAPDATGAIKVYVNTIPSTTVADISGIQIVAASTPSARAGQGLSVSGGVLNLGDTIAGRGPHSFTSNRYQNLNGHMYSIGDSVNDPLNHPAFRIYNNGDLAAGTTMDRSVYTGNQEGLRYYAKPGYLQIGASDRLDTTQNPIVYGIWPSSGIVINTDSANSIKGKIMNTIIVADESSIDSTVWMEDNFIAGEKLAFRVGSLNTIRSFIGGYANTFSAASDACVIDGMGINITKPVCCQLITGYGHVTQDTSYSSLIAGDHNAFGGLYQFVAGQYLVNRTPFGTTLGSSNVDFSTLGYTGIRAAFTPVNIPGIAGYPLFALGNGLSNNASVHSNALTVLFNGRTQINTTGYTHALAQTDVTPKAALDVVSTNTGVLLPRLTNAQRSAIVSGDLQNGLLLYNTDSSVFQYYTGSAWTSVGSGVGGGSGRWLFAPGTQFDTVNSIGIGTNNTQGYKLAVNGNAIFTKVKVKTFNTWPDYVFNRDYRLPNLTDLEQYIATHKHLPDMPSAEEVKKEGQDVGETQEKLLKKVEELTLYVIDLNKDVRHLHEKVDVLTRENEKLKKGLKKSAR